MLAIYLQYNKYITAQQFNLRTKNNFTIKLIEKVQTKHTKLHFKLLLSYENSQLLFSTFEISKSLTKTDKSARELSSTKQYLNSKALKPEYKHTKTIIKHNTKHNTKLINNTHFHNASSLLTFISWSNHSMLQG